jgi:uncharacterized protein YceH (UPF0502 family)
MLTLNPIECRVLGVLVEKAQTTPAQYPLSLNALATGCNQKNNRDPVTNLTEEEVLDAIDSMRAKGLVREVNLSGSRVNKFRHVARETLAVSTTELVLLSELLLRGPQSVGELRGRASRMHPIESLESAQAALDALASRAEPLARSLPRSPGERATRWTQLLCPDLHPLDAPPHTSVGEQARSSGGTNAGGEGLSSRVERLEAQVEALSRTVHSLANSLGVDLAPGDVDSAR